MPPVGCSSSPSWWSGARWGAAARVSAGPRRVCSLAVVMDWSNSLSPIRKALRRLRARSAPIGGETVVCCAKMGLSLFDELLSGRRDVILFAFDLLEFDGAERQSFVPKDGTARQSGRRLERLRKAGRLAGVGGNSLRSGN
jgi:hypothetical protein